MSHSGRESLSKLKHVKSLLIVAAIAAFAVALPASAGADVTPTATATFGSTTPGAHGDYTIQHDYTYSGVPSGVPSTSGDDLKQWIVDSPAGLIGNPNAVPAASRCDATTFETAAANPNTTSWVGVCPGYTASPAVVGEASLTLDVDASGATATTLAGVIFILSGSPEVPTKLGTIFPTSAPGGTTATYSISTIGPVASGPEGDYRLRTVSHEPINRPIVAAGPTYGNIAQIVQKLYGHVGNNPANPAFLTNPPRCGNWDSYLYAQSYGDVGGTANQTFTPQGTQGGTVAGTYAKAMSPTTTATCANLPKFGASVSAGFNTTVRSENPQLDVVVNNPNVPGGDVPKDVVVTLPGSIGADVEGIAPPKLCSIAQRDANACPAASVVGSVKVETPLIAAGLTGVVNLIRKDEGGLPNLAIFVTGAISFRLDATTKYVGSHGTEIQTILNTLPQVPFSKFSLTINGGQPDSLLNFRSCPENGTGPLDTPIRSQLTGYTGAAVTGSIPVAFDGCYSKPKVSSFKRCLAHNLKFRAKNVINRPGIMKIETWVKGRYGKRKMISRNTKSPFRFNIKLRKKVFTSGRNYKYLVRVVYKPTVDSPRPKVYYSKYAKFTKC